MTTISLKYSHAELLRVVAVQAGPRESFGCHGTIDATTMILDPASDPPGLPVAVCSCSDCGLTLAVECEADVDGDADGYVPKRLRNTYRAERRDHPPALHLAQVEGVARPLG